MTPQDTTHMQLIKAASHADPNISRWPKSDAGEVTFMAYGPEGRGYYLTHALAQSGNAEALAALIGQLTQPDAQQTKAGK